METNMERIKSYLEENKGAATIMAASALGVKERDVLDALPDEAVKASMENFIELMDAITEWGEMTIIVTNGSTIFEVKSVWPKGGVAHGFYNIHSKTAPVGGHLMIDKYDSIYFVSRPFMGMESHSVQIYDINGDAAIKFYLGRDENRQIKEDQKEKFFALKRRMTE